MTGDKITIKHYSLSQIMDSISSVISRTYSKPYWIKAEMIKLNYYNKSGHCYPDIAEKEGGKIRAQIRATLWSSTYFRLNANFVKKTGKPLSDGMNILFLAQVKHDALHGMTLNILEIDPDFELGQMAKNKLECISRLKSEGLFYLNKRLVFPLLPKRIAVISVETSKGYHDFINILKNNTRSYSFFTMLFPALLQGDAAVTSIIAQLRNIKKVAHHFDMVAIIRGGGGDVGLACYDDFDLAKEVATFPIPIISGIGHSTNETVVEMVANYNPITPTDLAYFLQQKFDNIAVGLEVFSDKLKVISMGIIDGENSRIGLINTFIVNNTKSVLQKHNNKISIISHKIKFSSNDFIKERNQRINHLAYKLGVITKQILKYEYSKTDNYIKNYRNIVKTVVNINSNKLEHLEEKLNLLRPENLLKKGYTLSLINGKPIKDISDIRKGDRLLTKLYQGEIESEIIKINK